MWLKILCPTLNGPSDKNSCNNKAMGLFWVSEELNNNIFKSLLNTTSLQNESDATIFVFVRVSEGLSIFPPVARPFHGQVMDKIGNTCNTLQSRAKNKYYDMKFYRLTV